MRYKIVFIVFTPFPGLVYSLTYIPLNLFFAHFYQENMLDLISSDGRIFLNIFPYFVAFTIPLYFLHHSRRKVVTLGELQASLVASAPVIPGGPETCRQCGATLEVVENVLGVTCRYWQSDNLVGIPPDFFTKTQKYSRLVGMDLLKAKKITKKCPAWDSKQLFP